MDNRFLKMPFAVDLTRLREDLAICEAEQWSGHYNTRDYDGEWTGIALRSVSGGTTDLLVQPDASSYADTPLLAQCVYFREILERFQCPVETVRLLALSPGSLIKTHRDRGLGYPHGAFRLHIPIVTDEQVIFRVDGCDLQMETGTCWYANFDLPHSVEHPGSIRRIHLVIDGLRNEWTDDWFGRAGYDFEAEQRSQQPDPDTLRSMIAELERMDTEVSRTLVAQLRAQLT